MEIRRCGSTPSRRAPAADFTGDVWQEVIAEPAPPARVRALVVRFDPGARTAWHTHPLGQTLFVVAGCGKAQSWGQPPVEIRAGDVIWFAPGEKHWHGATANTALTHIAIQEALDGRTADWLELVSDEQYQA